MVELVKVRVRSYGTVSEKVLTETELQVCV